MRNSGAAHAKSVSDAIERQLKEDAINSRKQAKVLLLGTDPNQSAIVRNMKLFNQNGLSDEELMSYLPAIHQNTLEGAQALIRDMCHMDVNWVHPTNCVNANLVLDYRVVDTPSFVFSAEIAQAIHQLLQDPIIPLVMERRSVEFPLADDANYFLENILRIGSPKYQPTENDVLRTRKKTNGLTETCLTLGQLQITIIDITGLRSQRKKWIHYFEGMTMVMFCARLSDYDRVLGNDKSLTQMHDSLIVFESVVNSPRFRQSSIMLFLTDIDGFKKKLHKVPLERYFPDYSGGTDSNKAAKYILWRFMQANQAKLAVYPHLTQLTDASSHRLLFTAVKETIVQNGIREAERCYSNESIWNSVSQTWVISGRESPMRTT